MTAAGVAGSGGAGTGIAGSEGIGIVWARGTTDTGGLGASGGGAGGGGGGEDVWQSLGVNAAS